MKRKKRKPRMKTATHVTFRIKKEDYVIILNRANMFCDGSISAWIRLAATQYLPDAEQLGLGEDPGNVEDELF